MNSKMPGLFMQGEAQDVAELKNAKGEVSLFVDMNNERSYLFIKIK